MDDFLLNEFKEFRKEYKHDIECLYKKIDLIIENYNRENNEIKNRLSTVEADLKNKSKTTALMLWLFSIIAGLVGTIIGKVF